MIKEITFNNAKDEKITGILKEKSASSPLIIVCHGYKSSHNHPAIESITDKLYQMGDSTFAFNFSKGAKGVNLMQQVSDLHDIISHFKDHKTFILLAGSFGSLSTVIASTTSSKVHGLVTINGFFGYRQLGPNLLKEYLLFRLAALFNTSYRKNWRYLHENLKPEKIEISTLMMHAIKDSDVSHSQSKRFFQKINTKKEFHLLETADHNLTRDNDRQEVAVTIDKWVRSNFPS